MQVVCCEEIKNVELWFLKDIKDFTGRKLIFANCPVCGQAVITLIEKRISDNEVFVNDNICGENAVKILFREQKRLQTKLFDIKSSDLFGWIYGVNIGIKNKHGEITQCRQYSTNFYGKRKLVKKIVQFK